MCVCAQHSMWKSEYNFQESDLYFLLCRIHGFNSGHQACATNAFLCRTTLIHVSLIFLWLLFEGYVQRITLLGTVTVGLVSFGWVMLLLFWFFMFIMQRTGVFQGLFCCFLKNQLYSFSWEGLGRSRNSEISSLVQQLRVPVSSRHYSLSGTVSVRAIMAGVPHCACAPAN